VKRLAELTTLDLAACPVWRYEGGSGAEARVSPVRRAALSQEDDEVFLAATDFELFDSTRQSGFCFPADGSGVDYLQPVIVTPSGHVAFWFEGAPSPETLAKQWRALGKEEKDIFPVSFRCLVPVDGRAPSGRIEGVAHSETRAPEPKGESSSRRGGIGAGQTRTTRRRKAEMTVEFSQGTLYGTGVTGDVSRRGMFVRSSLHPGTGPMLRLTVNLPGGRKLALTGRVVRSVGTGRPPAPSNGFGLRLADEWPEWDDLFGKGDRTNKKS
jgi:hypothetical protein